MWEKLFLFTEWVSHELYAGENVIYEDARNGKQNASAISRVEETVTEKSSSQEE